MAKWTQSDIPDQSGRTVIITGANSGVGYEATKALAAKNADVVMACRSEERANDAREGIDEGKENTEVMKLDLASLESIEEFADEYRSSHDEIDVLINNAGVMAIPRETTEDGFEKQIGVNHLGHFALTGHLIDLITDTQEDTRIVTHSSGMHTRGYIDLDDLHGEESYDRWDAYAQSKLANLLFAYELNRRLKANDSDLISAAVHPGYADTNLQRRAPEKMNSTLRLYAMHIANKLFAQSAKRGALPMLYAATMNDVEGGDYIGPGGFKNIRGYPEKQSSSKKSYDEDLAEELWELSEELTGVEYSF